MQRRVVIIVAGVLTLGIAFGVGRYSRPAKVETRVEQRVEYRDRVVKHQVTGPIHIVEREVTRPDGTKVVDRTEDRGPVTTDTMTEHQEQVQTKVDVRQETSRAVDRVRVSAVTAWRSDALRLQPELAGRVDLRVVGPVALWAEVVPPVAGQSLSARGGVALSVSW